MRSRQLKYQQELPLCALTVRAALGALSACTVLLRTMRTILFFCLAAAGSECCRPCQQYGRHGQ